MTAEHGETRQERRERKLQARRERMQKHGASLRRVYTAAVMKRAQSAMRARHKRGANDLPD